MVKISKNSFFVRPFVSWNLVFIWISKKCVPWKQMKIHSFIEIFLLFFLKMLVFNTFPDVLLRPKLDKFLFIGIHGRNKLRPKLSFNRRLHTFTIFLRQKVSSKDFVRLVLFLDQKCPWNTLADSLFFSTKVVLEILCQTCSFFRPKVSLKYFGRLTIFLD